MSQLDKELKIYTKTICHLLDESFPNFSKQTKKIDLGEGIVVEPHIDSVAVVDQSPVTPDFTANTIAQPRSSNLKYDNSAYATHKSKSTPRKRNHPKAKRINLFKIIGISSLLFTLVYALLNFYL